MYCWTNEDWAWLDIADSVLLKIDGFFTLCNASQSSAISPKPANQVRHWDSTFQPFSHVGLFLLIPQTLAFLSNSLWKPLF